MKFLLERRPRRDCPKIDRHTRIAPGTALLQHSTYLQEPRSACLFSHLLQQIVQTVDEGDRVFQLSTLAEHRLVQQHV